MLPVLRRCAEKTWSMRELADMIADDAGLSDAERAEVIPSGGSVVRSRVHWAKTYLKKAGLVDQPRRGYVEITERGRHLLVEKPTRIDTLLLRRYPGFSEFVETGNRNGQAAAPATQVSSIQVSATPEEQVDSALSVANAALRDDLLGRVLEASPPFFERLIIKLLVGMGYGGSQEDAGEHLGQSGDGGVDGVIKEDRLGLDRIFVQAKRYKAGSNVSGEVVQAFIGALVGRGAHKGVLITTSDFTKGARDAAERAGSLRIILLNGADLTRLMIDFNVGVRVKRTFELKSVDTDYFDGGHIE